MTALDLLNHLWQSTAVAVAVLILILLCRSISARTRRVLCWLALAKFAVPVTFFSPYELPIGPLEQLVLPAEDVRATRNAVVSMAVAAAPLDAPGTAGIAAAAAPAAAVQSDDWAFGEWLAPIWLIGSAVVIGSWILRAVAARRRILESSGPLPAAVEARLEAIAEKLKLEDTPRGLAIDGDLAPAVVGLISPIVVLPRGIEADLTPDELDAVLLHELVHVKRRDSILVAIQTLIVGLVWFNPIVWLISQRLYLESEKSCDERVLELTGDPESYAGGILKCVRRALGLPQPIYPSVSAPPVASRIQTILAHGTRPERPLLRRIIVTGVVTFASVGGLAGTFAAPTPIPTVSTLAAAPAPAARPSPEMARKPFHDSELLTVDQPNGDVAVIVHAIAELYQLDVIAPDLEGKVSLNLRGTWRQILTATLGPTGYVFEARGNSVIISEKPSPIARSLGPRSIRYRPPFAAAPPPVTPAPATVAPVASSAAAVMAIAALLEGDTPIEPAESNIIEDSKSTVPAQAPLSGITRIGADTMAIDFRAREVRSAIAEVAGAYALSVIIPEEISGRLSLSLSGVTWQHVLRTILDPLGYSFVQHGSVIKVAVNAPAQAPTAQPPRVNPYGEIFDPSKLDRIPQVITRVRPEATFAMRRNTETQTVTVEFIIDTKGTVPAAWATRSTATEFEKNAVAAVRRWKFLPGVKAGQSVNTHMVVDLVFNPNENAPVPRTAAAASPAPTAAAQAPKSVGPIQTQDSADIIGSPKSAAQGRDMGPAAIPSSGPSTGSAGSLVTTTAAGRRSSSGVTQFFDGEGRILLVIDEVGMIRLPPSVYEPAEVEQIPQVKVQFRPQYPPQMRQQGIAGKVKVEFVVDRNGNVAAAWAIDSTSPEFEKHATAAVAKWRFAPARISGKPVDVRMIVEIVFNLNDIK